MAPLAPGIVAEAFAVLVGDDGDRSEMVGVELARGQRLGSCLDRRLDNWIVDVRISATPRTEAIRFWFNMLILRTARRQAFARHVEEQRNC